VQGELLMDVSTDFPERLRRGVQVFVGEDHRPMRITHRRVHQNALLISLEGVDTAEQAGELRNSFVYVRADDRPKLPEGEYYHHQIIGLRVVTETGRLLGVLTQILETGANDVYIVQPEQGPEILLPAIEAVIGEIDLERGEMRVHPLPGLLPDEQEE